jgi:O-antigen/teichoic acid export membrane protein
MSRYKRIVKEGSWIVVGQIATVSGSLVLVRVLTEYLEPAQYGQLALGLTVAGFVNQLLMAGVIVGVGRFYSIAAEKQDLGSYLRATWHLLAYATFAVAAIGLVLMAGLWWLGYSQWIGLAASALVFSVLTGYNSSLSSIQNAARQRAIVAFHGGLDAWLKILLALGMLLWLGKFSTSVVVGYACSSLLITSSQLVFLRRTVPAKRTRVANHQQWMRQMWAYSWPLSAWGIFTWIQVVSDRWALGTFATTSVVGLYAVLFQLGYSPISTLTGMAASLVGPILYQRAGDATDPLRNSDVHQLAWRITLTGLLFTVIGFLVTLSLHHWIFRLFVAPQFRAASYLLPWMVVAGGLFAAGQMLALKLLSEMRTASMAMIKIVTALLGVLFNIYGAWVAGLQGVVGALIAFSAIYFIWMACLAVHSPETIT